MSLFGCDHRWVEVGRTFTPPPPVPPKLENSTIEFGQQVIFGLTNIEQRCERCGRVDVAQFTGKLGVE